MVPKLQIDSIKPNTKLQILLFVIFLLLLFLCEPNSYKEGPSQNLVLEQLAFHSHASNTFKFCSLQELEAKRKKKKVDFKISMKSQIQNLHYNKY